MVAGAASSEATLFSLSTRLPTHLWEHALHTGAVCACLHG